MMDEGGGTNTVEMGYEAGLGVASQIFQAPCV